VRFYSLTISDPQSGKVYVPKSDGTGFALKDVGPTFTSYANGQTKPGALNIEFHVPSSPFNKPRGKAWIRVWGVSLGMIGQASNFNPDPTTTPLKLGANVVLSAGFKQGLPLANPAQAGIILQGTVFQAFGNWQGVDQTLEFVITPPAAQPDQDISFTWPAGTSLASALSATFQQAFSQYRMTSVVDIADITQSSDGSGHYDNLSGLSDYVTDISQKLGRPTYGQDYSGVLISITGNTVFAYDSVHPRKLLQLQFQDLIGQPTWIEPATINFKTAMRSDITIGNLIKFPSQIAAPYALTSAAAAAPNVPSRSKLVFQGTFIVNEAHHFGNFREADADNWNSTFNAVVVPNS
jgi:hypothetical protein